MMTQTQPHQQSIDAHAATASARVPSVAPWLLRAAVLVHCWGMFAIVFAARPTHFGNLLFLTYELPFETAVRVEKVTVSIFLALGIAALLRPWWPVLLAIAGYTFLESWSGYTLGGDRYSDWVVFAHALRFTTPVALLMLVSFPKKTLLRARRMAAAKGLLRLAIATVFITHGMECFYENPRFIDLILGSTNNLLGVRLKESTAATALMVIFIVDLIVAAVILVYPLRPVLLWAALWGLITALSRVTALGMSEYTEVLVRASHCLAPLALLLLVAERERSPQNAASMRASDFFCQV